MTFQVNITPIAEAQIEQAYQWYRDRDPAFADRWFRELMNTIATLQEQPRRCPLAVEHKIFAEEVRQLLCGKKKAFTAFYSPSAIQQSSFCMCVITPKRL